MTNGRATVHCIRRDKWQCFKLLDTKVCYGGRDENDDSAELGFYGKMERAGWFVDDDNWGQRAVHYSIDFQPVLVIKFPPSSVTVGSIQIFFDEPAQQIDTDLPILTLLYNIPFAWQGGTCSNT